MSDKIQTKKAWLCSDCHEGHFNGNHVKCNGDIELNPQYGIYCSYCGSVTNVNNKKGIINCDICNIEIQFNLENE